MLPEYDLTGKTALVTGGGRGVGCGIALCLAEAGADVALVARTRTQLDEVAAEIRELGRRAFVAEADVREQASVQSAVDRSIAEFGDVDIVVNSAGTAMLKPIVYVDGMQFPGWQASVDGHNGSNWQESMTDHDWDLILDSNLRSVLNMARAIGPHMLARRSGRFVNVISCYYDVAPPYHSAYCVSKAGLHMLTRCLSTEWAPYGVLVNGIAPGNVTTDLNTTALEDPELTPWLDLIPLRRPASPREIGLLAVYLSSDACSFVTGETVVIDGGELSRANGL